MDALQDSPLLGDLPWGWRETDTWVIWHGLELRIVYAHGEYRATFGRLSHEWTESLPDVVAWLEWRMRVLARACRAMDATP